MNIIKRIIAQFKVPEGSYCYELLGTFLTEEGRSGIRTKLCPYWHRISTGGEDTIWCYLLDEGNDPLLDDQCKICHIKDAPEQD